MQFTKTTLFYNYFPLIFIYVVANGLLFKAGSTLSIIIPMIFIAYSAIYNYKYNRDFKQTKMMYIYILYFFILVFFSSNIPYSMKNVLKSFLPLLFFGLAVTFVKSYNDLNRLFKSLIILSFLYLLNLLISNIFNLGGGQYSDDEENYLQTGSIYSEALNSMGYYLVLIPAIVMLYPFKSKLRKNTIIITAVIILITLLLVLKRGSILIIGVGYLVLFLTAGFKLRSTIMKIIFIISLCLFISYPIYDDMLLSRIEVRQDRLAVQAYETEGRYLENEIVINDIIFSGNTNWLLFGHEVLNSAGNYGGGIAGERQLHNDYAQVLNGSGVIGFILYFLMNFSILAYYLRLKKTLISKQAYFKKEKMLNSVFMALFIIYFVLGLSGSIDSIIYNTIRFVIMGAIIGIFKNNILGYSKMRKI